MRKEKRASRCSWWAATPEVGVEQIGAALGVGHPAVIEVHAAPSRPRSRAKATAAPALVGMLAGVERRAARAQEDQVRGEAALAEALDRTDGRERIEPAPHPARPQHHPVAGADLREHLPQHRPRRPGAGGRAGRRGPRRRTAGTWGRRGSSRGSIRPAIPMPPSQRSRCFSLAHITKSATAHWPSIDFQALPRRGRARRRRPRPRAPRPSAGCRGRPRSAPACATRSAGAAAAAAGPPPRRAPCTASSSSSKSDSPASISASGASPTSLGPGAATVTSQRAATALASSSTRIAGPAIAGPTGSAEMKSTRVTRPSNGRAGERSSGIAGGPCGRASGVARAAAAAARARRSSRRAGAPARRRSR